MHSRHFFVVVLTSILGVLATDCTAQDSNLNIPAPLRWTLVVFLVSLSALFSGLTLGICGLDLLSLQVVMESGTPKQQDQARRILPVREDGNLLLCTLLLGNVAVNSALSILLADVAGGAVGFVLSTALIVLVGEIVPQSACSRHPLPVGAATAPLVQVFIFLLYPLAKPIAVALDKILGEEVTVKYSKQELVQLFDIQKEEHHVLSPTESKLLKGALDFQEKKVSTIMTKLDRVQMLHIDERLDFSVLLRIYRSGHSRIPVFTNSRTDIVGLLFAKDLVLVNPEDAIPVRTVLTHHSGISHSVDKSVTLEVMLNNFKAWAAHLAFVTDVDNETEGDPIRNIIGIVTLEDVIEEIISDELIDESDVFVSNESLEKASRVNSLMPLFAKNIVPSQGCLNESEVVSVSGFLKVSFPQLFGEFVLNDDALRQLIAKSEVIDVLLDSESSAVVARTLIQKHQSMDFAIFLLQGKVELETGIEGFRNQFGPFSFFASTALIEASFVSEFSVTFLNSVKYLRIAREDYQIARNSFQERQQATAVSVERPAWWSTVTVKPRRGSWARLFETNSPT